MSDEIIFCGNSAHTTAICKIKKMAIRIIKSETGASCRN
jgi:hypothetical protein